MEITENTATFGPCADCERVHGGWEPCPPFTAQEFAASSALLRAVSETFREGANQPRTARLFDRLVATVAAGLADTERLDKLERAGAIITLIHYGVLEWQSAAPPISLREAIDATPEPGMQRSGHQPAEVQP